MAQLARVQEELQCARGYNALLAEESVKYRQRWMSECRLNDLGDSPEIGFGQPDFSASSPIRDYC